MIGTVTAVSRTSITIGGPGHTITAAVTSATHITGKVTSLGGIKVGDHVSAQLTQGSGGVTAVMIADPAQSPSGEACRDAGFFQPGLGGLSACPQPRGARSGSWRQPGTGEAVACACS